MSDRLAEIRVEAAAIAADESFTPQDKLAKLGELKTEREALEAASAAEELAADLSAEPETAPEVVAEEAPVVEDAPVEGDPEDVAEVTPTELREAVAASSVKDIPVIKTETTFSGAIVASSNSDGLSIGSEITTGQLAKVHRAAGSSTANTKQPFGTIRIFEQGAERLGDHNSSWRNTAIMAAGSESKMQSITAAACFCGPDEAVKDICDPSSADRPVADLFKTLPTSGRFNYIQPLGIADVDTGVSIWTCLDQDGVDPDIASTWKDCADLECQTEITVEPYNIYQCANVSVQTQMSNPQLVDNLIHKLGVAYARKAEQQLLDQIVANSTVFNVNALTLGTGSLLNTLEFVGGQLPALDTYAERTLREDWVLVVPPGFIRALIADQHLRGGQDTRNRDEILEQVAQSLGVRRIVESLDTDTSGVNDFTTAITNLNGLGQANAQDWDQGGATPNNVEQFRVHIFNPNSFRHGSTDVVDAGWIRDGDLVRQNRVRYFFEGQEFLTNMCAEKAYTLDIVGCPSGVATAPDTAPLCN